jgi:hypothetical protein
MCATIMVNDAQPPSGKNNMAEIRRKMNENNLTHHIRQLLLAVGERHARDAILRERSAALQRPQRRDIADLRRWAQEYATVVDESVADMYFRVDRHANAILKLTTDPAIVGPVQVIADHMEKEISDVRDLIYEGERASSKADAVTIGFKMVGVGIRALPRQGQLAAAVAELERFLPAA